MASLVRPTRPASLTFLAVCQIVVGCVGLIYEVLKVGFTAMFLVSPAMLKEASKNVAVEVLTQVPFYFETHLAASLFGLVLSILLIVDGIGLLQVRRWAYNLGVLYGWLSIAYQVAWLAYLLMVAMPVKMAGFDNMPLPAGSPAMSPDAYRNLLKGAEIFDDATTAIGLTYPIFVLIMLGVTRKAFRRPAPLPEGADLDDAEAGRIPPVDDRLAAGYDEPDDRFGTGP